MLSLISGAEDISYSTAELYVSNFTHIKCSLYTDLIPFGSLGHSHLSGSNMAGLPTQFSSIPHQETWNKLKDTRPSYKSPPQLEAQSTSARTAIGRQRSISTDWLMVSQLPRNTVTVDRPCSSTSRHTASLPSPNISNRRIQTDNIRKIESCHSIELAADNVYVHVHYHEQILPVEIILEYLSSMGRQDSRSLIHSLDGKTGDIHIALLSYLRLKRSPRVRWKDEALPYEDISKLGKRRVVFEFFGHRLLSCVSYHVKFLSVVLLALLVIFVAHQLEGRHFI
jgi:hypothetical protein